MRVVAERAVRELVRARKTELTAPRASAALRTRCVVLAGLKRRWRASLAPFALAATLVIIVGGAFLYQATDRSAHVMVAELAADHIKCFALNTVLGTHDAPATVESSMLSGFGWHMRVPDALDRAGFELVGARPCLYAEGKIAHIMYRYQGRAVSIFMLPRTSRPEELVEVIGHEAAIWSIGDRTFVLVARGSRDAVQRMASFAREALR
jgi:anti-sigma factor RsiW